MKTSAVFALALLAATPFAVAQESKDAKIERLLDAMNAQSTIDQMFEQIKAMTASQIPPGATPEQAAKAHELQSKIMDLIKARMGWERMRPQYAKMYGETFSDEEISGMLAFYQSPAGHAMLSKMPALMAKVMELTQAQMADLLPEIQRITREAMPK